MMLNLRFPTDTGRCRPLSCKTGEVSKHVICASITEVFAAGWTRLGLKPFFSSINPMKKFSAVFLLLASLHARADLVVVEHVQVTNAGAQSPGGNVTIEFKDAKVRVTPNPEGAGQAPFSIILDTATGEITGLIDFMKSYVRISQNKLQDLIQHGKMRRGNAGVPDENADAPKLVDTGKQEKVGDYNAE